MDIKYMKGVGPKYAGCLARLGIHSTKDMIYHFPVRYEDRSKVVPLSQLPENTPVSVRGVLVSVEQRMTSKKHMAIITAGLTDGLDTLRLVWFNGSYLLNRLKKLAGQTVTIYGTVLSDRFGPVITGGDLLEDPDTDEIIVPVYKLTDGLTQNHVRKIVRSSLDYEAEMLAETLPDSIRQRYELIGLKEAVRAMHYPDGSENFLAARNRLAFEELLVLQLALAQRRRRLRLPGKGISFNIPSGFMREFEAMFPFALTDGQRRSVEEILRDMHRPDCMNRLLQGDVGSGKTLAALAAMMLCVRNGMQAAIMAPTEILAEQHYLNIVKMLKDKADEFMPVLLKGSLRAAERRLALERTASGEGKIIIGTHALIGEQVKFDRLGLVIVDEQHRFGVLQRTALYDKGDISLIGSRPDMLLMTATPIPRTLTNAVYGDLDVSVIDTMPPGRQPIKTHWKTPDERRRVYKALRTLLEQGQQAYVVCPLIDGSEQLSAKAATELYEELRDIYFPDMKLALLHGQQPAEEKETVMEDFRRGEIKILVATSVVEVGVDVANATCMIIESADRFGLSQLHQLRGRVGRGSLPGFCILISEGTTEDCRKRLNIMTSTTNGFVIAEEDLKLRGPGELSGVRQSGISDFRVADIFRDVKLLDTVKELARMIINSDPELAGEEWRKIRPSVTAKAKELETATG